MRIDLLIECINSINLCDPNDENDLKTINVCSNYIDLAYKDYKNNCIYEGMNILERSDFIKQFSNLSEFYSSLDNDTRSIRQIKKSRKKYIAKNKEEKERNKLKSQRYKNGINDINRAKNIGKAVIGTGAVLTTALIANKNKINKAKDNNE